MDESLNSGDAKKISSQSDQQFVCSLFVHMTRVGTPRHPNIQDRREFHLRRAEPRDFPHAISPRSPIVRRSRRISGFGA
jgi:hypothetical protein